MDEYSSEIEQLYKQIKIISLVSDSEKQLLNVVSRRLLEGKEIYEARDYSGDPLIVPVKKVVVLAYADPNVFRELLVKSFAKGVEFGKKEERPLAFDEGYTAGKFYAKSKEQKAEK